MRKANHRRTLTRGGGRAPRVEGVRDISVTYEGRDENVAIRPPDVSARGMFINTTHEFPIGAVLALKFRLALSGARLRARAEVRYCLRGVGVGVEFVEVSKQQMRAIEREITLNENRGKPRSRASRPRPK